MHSQYPAAVFSFSSRQEIPNFFVSESAPINQEETGIIRALPAGGLTFLCGWGWPVRVRKFRNTLAATFDRYLQHLTHPPHSPSVTTPNLCRSCQKSFSCKSTLAENHGLKACNAQSQPREGKCSCPVT